MDFIEISPQIQSLFNQVNYIYQHPLHYTYLLHKNDGFLHLYDLATMDVVGKTKVIVLDQMKLFAFTHDFNIIYGLRESRFLCFQLSSTQWLTHQPVEATNEPRPYFEAQYLSFYPKRHILVCVTATNFFLVNPNMGSAFKAAPPLKYQESQIFPEKVAQISPHIWIVGHKNYVYFMKFSQSYDSYDIFGRLMTGNVVKLSAQNHPKREFIYVINDQEEVLLIRVDERQKKLDLCYRFFNQNFSPLYMTLLTLGINTSTTDKLKNRMYINVYCEKKLKEKIVQEKQKIVQEKQDDLMVDEKLEVQQQKLAQKQYCLIVIPTDLQYMTEEASESIFEESYFSLNVHKQTFIIRNMPVLKTSPWTNVFTQNCIMFLNSNNQVSSINFCSIPQMNLKADQWICMGYKFQMLEKNQVYEEREDEFEQNSEKEVKPLTRDFLDDWSQSNLPKNVILGHTLNRMRSIDI